MPGPTRSAHFIRQRRVEKFFLLADQAKALGMSCAYVSQIELGQRRPPEGYFAKVAKFLDLNEDQTEELFLLAGAEQKLIKFKPVDEKRASLAAQFALKLNTLSDESLSALRAILNRKRKKTNENHEIELIAEKLVKVFRELPGTLVHKIENGIPQGARDFSLRIHPDGRYGRTVRGRCKPVRVAPYIDVPETTYLRAVNQDPEALYDLAHELAHYLLHRWRGRHELYLAWDRDQDREQEADRLARAIMLPRTHLKKGDEVATLSDWFRTPERVSRQRKEDLFRASNTFNPDVYDGLIRLRDSIGARKSEPQNVVSKKKAGDDLVIDRLTTFEHGATTSLHPAGDIEAAPPQGRREAAEQQNEPNPEGNSCTGGCEAVDNVLSLTTRPKAALTKPQQIVAPISSNRGEYRQTLEALGRYSMKNPLPFADED
jgi:transcriptional regulator with XRE-family HTH domain